MILAMPKRRERRAAPTHDRRPEASPQVDGAPATVLVVDDEPHNLEVVTHFLEAEGFQVVTAEDGEQALAVATGAAPDVILLDVIMPAPDGFEVCRRLKADPATVFIPIVILTALKSTKDRITGAAAGADDFLSKPFDHVELVTRVRSLVRVKRLHDQVEAYSRELEIRVAERTAELQQALTQLQEFDRLKSEFIANVSHELRTPLLHVKGYLDLLANGALGAVTAEQLQGAAIAQEAASQLDRGVQDIVDFRDFGDRRFHFERVAVADAAQAAREAITPFAARRGVTVTLTLPPDLPPVWADRAAVARVLRHLLDNAVKFSPSGGVVRVIGEEREGSVRIAVLDHGEGIPPEKLDRIFDLFYQADGSTTRRAGGLGLGLALVKMLLDAHAAHLQVESEVGRGSTFYFDLSAAAP